MPTDLDLGPALWVLSGSVLAVAALRLFEALAHRHLRRRTEEAIERALDDGDRR